MSACTPYEVRRDLAAAAASGWYSRARAVLEWTAALALLLACGPVLLLIAALMWWSDPGPVLYTQTRLGKGGREFRIYKLRTMTHGCEARTGPVWAMRDDPRTTRLGRWLRATHLDELPQLWNVLRGDMSLIGPRPERPEIALQIQRILPNFGERLAVRPGLSGLAQLLLPPDADLDSVRFKLAHDLAYISRSGPSLDLRIAVATLLHLAGVARGVQLRLIRPYAAERAIEAPRGAPTLRLTLADAPSRRVNVEAGIEALSKAA